MDLSWRDGAKLQLATYFASPRMWPLGYILGSDYSPINLERHFPDFNWRDPFEDLLILEHGKKMISAVSRQKEAATASRLRNESVHEDISRVNSGLQRNQDYVSLLQKMREISVRRKRSHLVSLIDEEAIPYQKETSEIEIAYGKSLIKELKYLENKPASSYKKKVPWIISLISSGAMPGWESVMYDSADGLLADVFKTDGSGDGQMFSELDLALIFKKEHRIDFRGPRWSTFDGSYDDHYSQIDQLHPEEGSDPFTENAYETILDLPPSILSQSTTVQRKKSWNGSLETRVVLKNRFTDGTDEEKMIVNDASKVLEEVEKAQRSIKQRHYGIGLALWQLAYRRQEDSLAAAKEMEDDDVD